MKVYVNGRLVPEARAHISVLDHGFLYGDGIFETLRAYGGVVFRLKQHLQRLKRSASMIKLRIPWSPAELSEIIYKTIEANNLSDAYIRVTVTRGEGPPGLDPSLCPRPTLVVIARPLHRKPSSVYRRGVKVIVSSVRRNLREAVDPRIKSMNFLNNILAMAEAKRSRAHEAIMLNSKGYVTEGTVSNVFMVTGGRLVTPSVDSGILDGITRNVTIELARRLGIGVIEKKVALKEMFGAEEIFLTNTTLEIMPVRQVDAARKKRGPVTDRLMSAFKEMVEKEISRERERRGMY